MVAKILIVYQFNFLAPRSIRGWPRPRSKRTKKAPRERPGRAASQRGKGARRAGGDKRRARPNERDRSRIVPRLHESEAYCFFVIGVTGCEPPVDFGPGVTPELFSSFCVAVLELLAAVEPIFGVAPEVCPLPASLVDTAPLIGPLPASIFDCANAGAERPTATAAARKVVPNEDMTISFDKGTRGINPLLGTEFRRPCRDQWRRLGYRANAQQAKAIPANDLGQEAGNLHLIPSEKGRPEGRPVAKQNGRRVAPTAGL